MKQLKVKFENEQQVINSIFIRKTHFTTMYNYNTSLPILYGNEDNVICL